ncbi:MAG: MDR family MFS transporter, partial [Microvirgula sp.]
MSAGPVRSRSQSVAAMLGICLVMLLIALDQTVVGTALPRVVAELQGFALYQWVASAYLLTTAVMIPIAGRLGDLHGRKGLVLAAIVVFTLASALCGMADSMLQLVLARGLQGIGGGMLAGTAFACVSDLFPEPLERVRWQAMLSASFGIATAMGPVLGGWLTEHLGWRSVFYVNLPVALLALPAVWIFLPHIVHRRADDAGIDWGGALLLTLSMCGLLAIVLCTVFVRHQRRSRAPVIPARLFATPAVRQLCAISALTGLAMFVLVFYAPLLLQGGFGFSPKMAGLLVTPLLVCVTIGSIINGRLMPRLAHPEKLISWGLLGLMAGCALLVTLEHDSPVIWLALVFGLCGLSLGFQLPNLTLQVQSAVTRQDTGIASALIQTNRTLGSMFGASLAGMLVNVRYGHEIG